MSAHALQRRDAFAFFPLMKALLAAALLLASLGAYAAAGTVQFVAGDVKIRDAAGALRVAVKGATVDEGDTILTAAGASAQVKMADGGIIAVRPETDLKVDTYRFAGKEDGSERAVMSLLKGGFRTITGLIGRTNKQNYTINTPTATIGIRGTDHEPFVVSAAGGGGKPGVAAGTYDKVNVGVAVIRSQGAEMSVAQNQVGFAAPGKPPVLLPAMPDIFKAPPPVRQSQQQKEKPSEQSTQQASAGGSEAQESGSNSSSGTAESTQSASSGTASGGTTSTAGSTTDTSVASTSATSVPSATAPPTVVQSITGTSDNGAVVNLTTGTVKSTEGTIVPIGDAGNILRDPEPPTTRTSRTAIVTNYAFGTSFAQFRPNVFETGTLLPAVLDENGNFLGVIDNDLMNDFRALIVSGGAAGATSVVKASSFDRTGITMGWRAATPDLTVTGIDFDGVFLDRRVLADGFSWIMGPAPTPAYLPGVLGGNAISGTATYVFDGATTPRDQNGQAGTLNAASLSVNFTKQSVNLGLDVTTGAGRWLASAADVRMQDSGEFSAFSGSEITTPSGIDTHRRLVVTRDGSSASTFGSVQGRLMGIALAGAGLTYGLGDMSGPYRVSGAVAFAGPAQDVDASYRLLGMVIGMGPTASALEEDRTAMTGGFLAASRTQFSGGVPVRVDAEYRVLTQPGGCTSCTLSGASLPAVYAVTGATGVASIGTATVRDSGSDPVTGLSWGRYGGAPGETIGITDRISGASLGTLDVSQQSLHYITAGVQSGPVVLPITGTATYTLVGNTNPTDNLGNVGVLGSATLKANFTAQTVDTAVNLTVANSNWAAKALGVPIVGGVFEAKKTSAGIINLLEVSRDSVSSNTSGKIVGAFTGPTGNGAAVLYSLNQGGATGTTVSGVAAFRK